MTLSVLGFVKTMTVDCLYSPLLRLAFDECFPSGLLGIQFAIHIHTGIRTTTLQCRTILKHLILARCVDEVSMHFQRSREQLVLAAVDCIILEQDVGLDDPNLSEPGTIFSGLWIVSLLYNDLESL